MMSNQGRALFRRGGSPIAWCLTARKGRLRAGMLTVGLAGAGASTLHAQQPRPAVSLVFDRVTVVDVEHGQLVRDQRVVVVGTRLQTMGRARAVKLPQGAQVVDARGKYLIPGLWDMHTHLSLGVGPPRQLLSGVMINGPQGSCVRCKRTARVCVVDAADARHLIDSLTAAGADMLKTYSLSRELYFVVAAASRRLDAVRWSCRNLQSADGRDGERGLG